MELEPLNDAGTTPLGPTEPGENAARGEHAENRAIAEKLREAAELLQGPEENAYRVAAYLRAADVLESLEESVSELVAREGKKGLLRLPGVGDKIAAAAAEVVQTGRWTKLERMRSAAELERVFREARGVGKVLTARIREATGAETTEELEAALVDGRLAAVHGIGPRRVAWLRASLFAAIQRLRTPALRKTVGAEPSLAALLDVDHEYRDRARRGDLPTIAPRANNPEGTSWLPLLRTSRGGWNFTAMYSNTARAHELGKTGDWVVVYFDDGDRRGGRRTVVTETSGPAAGRRVVRGREADVRPRRVA